ncbi:hypothetical protein PCK2_000658, partial [Pneumocystis canis]
MNIHLDARRKRRQIRARRGVQLPEFNERPKTQRTPIVHSVLVPEKFYIDQYGINRMPMHGLNDDDELEKLLNEKQRTPPLLREPRTKVPVQQQMVSPSKSPSHYLLKLKVPRLKEFLATLSGMKSHSSSHAVGYWFDVVLPSWLASALEGLRH